MKIAFILLGLVLCVQATAQNLLTFGPEIQVADGYGNLRPRIALSNGNPIVIWGGGSGTQPVYSSFYNGTSFSSPQAIHPTNMDVFSTWWAGPDIAAYGDTVYVAFKGVPEDSLPVYVVKSIDGGQSWGDTIPLGVYGGFTRFPEIEIASGGNPVIAYMDFMPGWSTPQYSFQKSSDGGLSWQSVQNISQGSNGEVCDCCESELLTYGQDVVLAYRNNDANTRDMWLSHSNDGGANFSNDIDIDDMNWFISVCPSSGPDIVATNDSLYSVWMTGSSGNIRVRLSKLDKSSLTFNGQSKDLRPNSLSTVYQNYPRIASNNNSLAVVWEQTEAGNKDIQLLASMSGSTGLGDTSFMVNSDPTGYQRNPDIKMDNNNVMHIVWQDDQTGNVMYRTAQFSGVGVAENKDIDLSVYPNPASSRINIEANDIILSCQISDNSGKIVKTIKSINASTFFVNISDLANGNYLIDLINIEGRHIVEKLIVE